MKRFIVAFAVGVALFAVVAFATPLNVVPSNLSAGGADVPGCDDEVQVFWNVQWTNQAPGPGLVVHLVNVSGINSNCTGSDIVVTLTENGNFLDQRTVINWDGTDPPPVDFGGSVLASSVTDVHVAIIN